MKTQETENIEIISIEDIDTSFQKTSKNLRENIGKFECENPENKTSEITTNQQNYISDWQIEEE